MDMGGIEMPHDHFHSHGKPQRELPSSGNVHVDMVNYVLRVTKAEVLFEIFNDLIQPLPKMGQALASTLMISIVPIFFIYGLNMACLSNKRTRDSVLFYLISFAIGGLLGDVFFHTLPHLSAPSAGSEAAHHHHHDHEGGNSHSHDPKVMENNLIIVVGIVSFFLIEKMVHSYLGVSDHSHSSDGKSEKD
jgi:hypothetical protein